MSHPRFENGSNPSSDKIEYNDALGKYTPKSHEKSSLGSQITLHFSHRTRPLGPHTRPLALLSFSQTPVEKSTTLLNGLAPECQVVVPPRVVINLWRKMSIECTTLVDARLLYRLNGRSIIGRPTSSGADFMGPEGLEPPIFEPLGSCNIGLSAPQ